MHNTLLRQTIKEYLHSLNKLLSPGLTLRLKQDDDVRGLLTGEQFTIDSVNTDCVVLVRNNNIGPKNIIVSYDELENYFELA